MAIFTVAKTESKTINIELLKTEVNADGTINAEATCLRIVNNGSTGYTFEFDDTAFDNNGALSAGADTALDAVIAAHDPFGGGPGDPPFGGFKIKSGVIAVGSFSGNPKVASVTFSTAYATNEDYAVTFSVVTNNQKTQYAPIVSSKSATGFDVSLGTSSTSNLVELHWHSLSVGEEG